MHDRRWRQGFTLIELTIALAFLSILLIAILTLTLASGKLYVKGMTNKTVNQSGREIQDIVRRDFLAADASDIGNVLTEGSGLSISGRICLGSVTYLWNTADILNDTSANGTTYRIRLSTSTPIRFARVVDVNAELCVANPLGRFPVTIPTTLATTELLGGDGRDFAMYSMAINSISKRDKRGLYEMKYTIGTNDQGTVESDDGYVRCKPDATATANFDYCSVTDFDMMLRVEGGVR